MKTIQIPTDDSEASVELRRRIENWGVYRYSPIRKPLNDQLGFHLDQSTVRIIIGSNRSGKTECPLAEAAAIGLGEPYPWWLRGWKVLPKPPASCWIVIPVFNESPTADARIKKLFIGEESSDTQGNRILKPPLIPREMIDWHSSDWQHVKLVNGSTYDFKSSQQQSIQLASANVDLIIYDEPTKQTHWDEGVARLLALPYSRLIHCLTDTALKARYLNRILAKPGIPVFHFTTAGNPYRNKEHADEIASLMDERERDVRIKGYRFSDTLLCYPNVFKWVDRNGQPIDSPCGTGNWIAPQVIPDHWTKYVIHDPGKSNPAAAVWFAVDPQGNIHAYKMRYWERPPSGIGRVILDLLETNAGDKIERWYIDPVAAQQPIHGGDYYERGRREIDIYREMSDEHGIFWYLGTPKLQRMKRRDRLAYLEAYLDPTDKVHPMIWFHDTPDMQPLRYEFQQYRMAVSKDPDRNNPEATHDKDNHAIYCCEAACVMPINYEYKSNSYAYNHFDDMNRFMAGNKAEGWDVIYGRA